MKRDGIEFVTIKILHNYLYGKDTTGSQILTK